MHVPYPPIAGGRILTKGHSNSFTFENAVDGLGMAAVLFDLSRVLEGFAAYRCPPQTNQLAGWFFCALNVVFCLWFPPFSSQCLCEFKALKVLVSYGPEYRNELFGGGYMGKWVSGFLTR